jgi:hypothetical protein
VGRLKERVWNAIFDFLVEEISGCNELDLEK